MEAGPDQTVDEGEEVDFDGSFTDAGSQDTHTIEWDFGDGQTTSSTLTPTHTYADNGVYSVTLTVTDKDGGVGSDILLVTVNNLAPNVEAGSDQIADEGEAVDFSGSFTDAGSQDIHTTTWDFGDGQNASGTLIPSHTYADNGVYTVILTVTDNDGGIGSDSLLVTVNNVAPDVEAGPDQIADEGEEVDFNGSFTDVGVQDTHTTTWDFGDGQTTSGVLTPGHTYVDNGVYTVTLTVTDNDDGVGNDSLVVTINNLAPEVEAGPDQTGDEGEEVDFSGSFTDAGSQDAHTTEWDFGDGQISSGTLTPDHTYADNGVYTVTLTVTDNDGDVGNDSLVVTINNLAPDVDAGPDQIADEGEEVDFNGSFTDPGTLDTQTIEWDFGDGQTASGTLTSNHTYADNGIYTVTLTITDNDDGVGSDSLVVTVNNVAPDVDAGPDQTGDEGEEVSFNGSFIDPSSEDTHTIVWNFGDGETTNTLTSTHIYADSGVYTVTLTVTDNDGGVGNDTLLVTVNNLAPNVDAGPDQTADEGEEVDFSGSFTDAGSQDAHTIEWDFGDGQAASGTLSPNHIYDDDGVYTVVLTITDDDGGVGSDSLVVTVNNMAPDVEAGSDQTVDEGEEVNFNGSFTDPGSQDTHTTTWDFGDGETTSGTLSPNHVYAQEGVYTVTLTVTDNDGATGQDSLQVTVNYVPPPLACLHATESLDLRDRTLVSVPTVYGGNYFELGANALLQGDVVVNGNAFLRSYARVEGDVTLAGTLSEQLGAEIEGTLTENAPVAVPVIPTQSVIWGSTNLTVNNDQQATWTPGNYKDGMVRARGTVILSAGTYNFRTLQIEPDAQMILDTTDGEIVINVSQYLGFGDRARITPDDPALVKFYTNYSGTVRIGTDLRFNGTLIAPQAWIQVFSRTAGGCLVARQVSIEPDAVLQ